MNAIRALGGGRMLVGAAVLATPTVAARLFTGERGETAETELFVRGFGARDLAIGAGMLVSRSPRLWLGAAFAADAADTAAVILDWDRLDRRQRVVALVASAAPALIEASILLGKR